jgi:hypothetical protein
MNKSSFGSSEQKVYRFNSLYRWYHFVVGAVFLVAAVLIHDLLCSWAIRPDSILSIGAALFSVFMIARPLIMAVIVDGNSVTFKGMFSQYSLQRSSITAVETRNTGKGTLLILRGNIQEEEELTIPVNQFAFDEAWDEWLGTYKDLGSDKPLSLF